MYFNNRKTNYDKRPLKVMNELKEHAWKGYKDIGKEILNNCEDNDVIVIEMYHGTNVQEIENELISLLNPSLTIFCEEAKLPEEVLSVMLKRNITDDRVFGSLSTHKMKDFYDEDKVEAIRDKVNNSEGLKVIYGTGASYVYPTGKLVYCDLTRWEIQLRYRKGLDNWGVGNYDEDILRKVKRGYFVEWRVQDRLKVENFNRIQWYIDTNRENDPSMIDSFALEMVMDKFANEPFRLIPYFDEGIWGGKWMEEVCDLTPQKNNYAWGFDGVPEENSIGIKVDDIEVELPAINLVKMKPKELLGAKVYSRFGAEFPIRFDFLDTMGGGNLSLQVHPLTEYIQQEFGMPYTQDESYYILDAGENATVYLGVKEGVTASQLIPALKRAERGEEQFDDTKYINCFPIKKHDHVLIPAGTIHCSGSEAMVLEISATPYIFTMKLWDWGRVGFDGKPRPINVDRGAKNIQYDRTTAWCKENLLNNFVTLEENEAVKIEKTGLHELEFIETDRYWFKGKTTFKCHESVNMLNLIEGEEVLVSAINGEFEPVEIHYAETFVVPESVKEYYIEPIGKSKNEKVGIIQAFVKVS